MVVDRREGWLKDLKVGDQVVESSRYAVSPGVVTTVSRITPSGFINTKSGNSYLPGGSERGASEYFFSSIHLMQYTQELKNRIGLFNARKIKLDRIKKFNFDALNLSELEQVVSIIDSSNKEGK